MDFKALAVVHCQPKIGWQREFLPKLVRGLGRLGIPHEVTDSSVRTSDALAVLLGTTCWRAVEPGGPFLLVDRCSFGDTNTWITLVRDGHGRRGDLRVPDSPDPARWERHGPLMGSWQTGPRAVLCGQYESWSPRWPDLADWYAATRGAATHFRRHPAGVNPTGLPELRSWSCVGRAITLNSSIGVEAVLAGVPTVTMDEGAMAWDVTSHDPAETVTPDRESWAHWLAWTQWTHDEIAEGTPWAHYL